MEGIVVGLGELLWDMLPEGRRVGGAPANFAHHIGQFGIDSCVVSAIGFDREGTDLANSLGAGVKKHLCVVDKPTGRVDVSLDDKGVPSYIIREGVAWDYIPYSDDLAEIAKNTVAVCFGSLAQRSGVSRATIARFIDAIPAANNPLIVFDINLRGDYFTPESIAESLKRCNVLKINDEELERMGKFFGTEGMSQTDACRKILQEYSLRIVILTCGTDGSYVVTDSGLSFLPTPVVEVADTVGAGDSFTAAFVASLLKGRSIREAHRCAVDTSAYVCSCHGATPQLPAELTR